MKRLRVVGLPLALAALAGACRPTAAPDAGADYPPIRPRCLDSDGDGVLGSGECASVASIDCNDEDPLVYPGAPERCNGKDDNCNVQVDEGLASTTYYADVDGDGFGAGAPLRACQMPSGAASSSDDCDDSDSSVRPGAPEACDGMDNDCNGQVDENVQFQKFYTDADRDGYGSGPAETSCKTSIDGKVTRTGDCADGDAAVHPAAAELCDGSDNNCDGQVDETFGTQGGACGTSELGVCAAGTLQCIGGIVRCQKAQQASTERCDDLDNDCNGLVDEAFANKGAVCTAGVGACARNGIFVCTGGGTGTECSATQTSPSAPACEGVDNDCDGIVDEVELASHAMVASGVDATTLEVSPFYYSASSCNGGQSAGGTDAFVSNMAAFVRAGSLYVQELREDGAAKSVPLNISPFSLNVEADIAQAGSGLVVATLYGTGYLDLYYVGPGPNARNLNGDGFFNLHATSTANISNVRVVRGNGGRVVIVWRETSGTSTRIRMARVSLSGFGIIWAVNVLTPPMDLVAIAGDIGVLAVGASHERYGDAIGCPTGLGRVALAYKVGHTLKLDVFTEDGVATGTSYALYSGASDRVPASPDVAWVSSSGDLWAATFTVAWSATNDQGVYFWQSAGSFSTFGSFYGGNGTSSVSEPRLAARPNEFLLTALVSGSPNVAQEPQAYGGKLSWDGATVSPLGKLTVFSGCTGAACAGGTKKLVRPMSGSGGPLKNAGAVLYGGSEGNLVSGVINCN